MGAGPYHLVPLVSCSIGQALPDNTLHYAISAGDVIHAQRDAVVVAEIELRKIAVKVLFCTMLIGALHAALENREHAFDGIGVNVAANVFLRHPVMGAVELANKCNLLSSVHLRRHCNVSVALVVDDRTIKL